MKAITNQIATPIQTETYLDIDEDGLAESNELLSLQRTNYRDWGSDMILPDYIETLKGEYNPSTNNLQERINFESYYDSGNLQEVSKTDGTSIVYIWGYNEDYPIAKIENATYSDIVNLSSFGTNFSISEELSITQENQLRGLSNAMVTTYTYDPLTGITSMTDPKGYTTYYEYDDFNRLKQVKDADGNVVSHNEYHYKGQQ